MTTLSNRPLNMGALARALVLVCAVVLVGLVSGRVAISHYGVVAAEVLLAIPIVVMLGPRPFVACALLLALLCSAPFYTWVPRVNLPGHPPVNLADILLVVTVGATLWRRPWHTWPLPVRRIYLAVGVMLVMALIPTIAAAMHGHDTARAAINGFKDLLFVTLGITVALELSGRLWWPLVNLAVGLASVVAILSIMAAASGSIGHVLTSLDAGAVFNSAADVTVGTTSRIRLPGLFFVYAMTIPTLVLVLLVKDRWRLARLGGLLLMVGAIAVSLNRNMYLGGAAGLLVTLLLGGAPLRYRFVIVAATTAAVITLVVQTTVTPAVTKEVTARAQSALTSNVLASGSLQDRADEFSHAATSISRHPWIGVGWLGNYGSYVGDVPRAGVEDWYLDVATDLGIPVAVAFAIVAASLLAYGTKAALRARSPLDRAMVAAGVGTLVALLLSCLVGTYLQDANSMTAFSFACGFLVAAGLRATRAERSERGADAAEAP